MKAKKSDIDSLVFQKLFEHVKYNSSEITLWQTEPSTGYRNIIPSNFNSIQYNEALLFLNINKEHNIVPELPVYCYSKSGQFIFKSEIKIIKDQVLTLVLPSEVQLLGGQDPVKVKTMEERSLRDQEFLSNEFGNLSLDEEDKLFADKRESPRARPKIEKWVKVKIQGSEGVNLVKLFDLSRGGLGFITIEPHLYQKSSEIQVVGFESFDLDDPILGVIVAQRPVDNSQVEFKIGVKFSEGQN